MKWWQVALLVAYHIVLAYAFASHINGSNLL
jgi:hypothetical protein